MTKYVAARCAIAVAALILNGCGGSLEIKGGSAPAPAAAPAVVATPTAAPRETVAPEDTVVALLQLCDAADQVSKNRCANEISNASSVTAMKGVSCAPGGESKDQRQRLVLAWLRAHPDEASNHRGVGMFHALAAVDPCP